LTDSGVFQHRDLIDNLADGANLISSEKATDNSDRTGHGTGLAGLIVGHGHNSGEGVLGIAPESRLIPIKVTNGPTDQAILGAGIALATTLGAKVINVSLIGGPSRQLASAVETAAQADAVLVAASGNDWKAATIGYPAALPGVLAVGAIDKSGKHASFSTSGSNLGICAPGTEIVTTGPGTKYSTVEGTSASAAIVSGAAALVRAKFPELSAPEVIHRLTATATDIGPPGRDEQCGYGVLNILKALTADVPPLNNGPGSAGAVPGASSSVVAGGPGEGSGWRKAGLLGGIVAVLAGVSLVAFLAVRRRRRQRP
jgi:subtilisin family serine protease